MKAATSGGNTAIAVRGEKTAAFITQKKIPVRLIFDSLMNIRELSFPHIFLSG